jgi:hypothetical protein
VRGAEVLRAAHPLSWPAQAFRPAWRRAASLFLASALSPGVAAFSTAVGFPPFLILSASPRMSSTILPCSLIAASTAGCRLFGGVTATICFSRL